MRNANAVGQPKGGVGPSLASQGFTGIVPLKPSTEGIENIAFNDFTLGVDTTALVQAENIYEVSDAFSRILGKHGLKPAARSTPTRSTPIPTYLQRQLRLQRLGDRAWTLPISCWACPPATRRGRRAASTTATCIWRPLRRTVGRPPSQLTVNYGVRWDRIRPWEREIQPVADAGEGRAVAGLSRRAAGAGLSRRSRRAPLAGSGAQRLCSALRHGVLARLQRRRGCASSPGRRARPASAPATACSTPRTKGYRRAS